jgi:hypothetical protein
MICEKCGHEITDVLVGVFNRDGSDGDYRHPIIECEENAAVIDTIPNWTGYELTEEEQRETIHCPYCKDFPFNSTEIQVETIARIICFKQEVSP